MVPNQTASLVDLRTHSPYEAYEFVDVEFPAAGSDCIIRHGLRPLSPRNVHYQVVRQSTAGTIYEDQSVTRTDWTDRYIVLRSDTTGWTGRLLLSLMRNQGDME